MSHGNGNLAGFEASMTAERISMIERDRIDRLPGAFNDLYPLPTRVPDDLKVLIDEIVEATRRASN